MLDSSIKIRGMRTNSNALPTALGLKYPLIVAPMAGGVSTAQLVATTSDAGALGSIAAAYLAPGAIASAALEVRAQTQKPFAINLFIPERTPEVSPTILLQAIAKTERFRAELSVPPPSIKAPYRENFDSQFETVLRLKPKVFSFIFGVLAPEYLRGAQREGIFTIGTATSPDEARVLEESGVDAVIVQGLEAGGHRGIFDPSATDPMISALDLVRTVVKKLKIPVIAAGGIMTSQHIKTMLDAGASAVQMGTAFLTTQEAGTAPPYRSQLLESPQRQTKTTRAFSGRLARGIVNRFMLEMDANPGAILPFPAQNDFTRSLRNASAAQGISDFMSLWSGTGEGTLWTGPAKALIESLFA